LLTDTVFKTFFRSERRFFTFHFFGVSKER
jgi:hypothetical protein